MLALAASRRICYRFNGVLIELLQAARRVERHPVDDIQRIVEAEAADALAADPYRSARTRVPVGEDLHTGNLTLQALHDAAGRSILDLLMSSSKRLRQRPFSSPSYSR